MDLKIKDDFIRKWDKYFPGTEHPLIFYYTDNDKIAPKAESSGSWQCFICQLTRVRNGHPLLFNKESIGCGGGRQYLGFDPEPRPDFEYFLSCGKDEMEGIRHKKTAELVKESYKSLPPFKVREKYIVFKRWGNLEKIDDPLGVVFFASGDVLAGLFILANFDEATPHGVISPNCSGCSSIVYYPYMESQKESPRAIFGMFDISARKCVKKDILTFAVPMKKFVRMIYNMDESFLITDTWAKLKKRIPK